jgi:DNA-binding response OmpR family regulator
LLGINYKGVSEMNSYECAIMLVEDDPIEIDLARRACQLKEPALHLVVVKDCLGVLEWLATASAAYDHLPKLILLDLKLPQLLGLAMLRRLRMASATWDLPIIVYSKIHEPSDVVMSYQVGANSFVNKPENIEQFNALLHELSDYWLNPRQRKLSLESN